MKLFIKNDDNSKNIIIQQENQPTDEKTLLDNRLIYLEYKIQRNIN